MFQQYGPVRAHPKPRIVRAALVSAGYVATAAVVGAAAGWWVNR